MGKSLNNQEIEKLLIALEKRFSQNMHRHQNIKWEDVLSKLKQSSNKLTSLYLMEMTEGEPDIIDYSTNGTTFIYCDCSQESPKGRRSLCFDEAARLSRKKFPPQSSVEKMLFEMGINLIDEKLYRYLQSIEDFDLKTSSWLKTPEKIRKLGGAIFGDKRYLTTFIYHNSAESYYGSRGFRGFIEI